MLQHLYTHEVLRVNESNSQLCDDECGCVDCDYPFANIINDTDDIDFITSHQAIAKWMQFKRHIVFGTGGSSLGGQAIYAMSGTKKDIKFVNNIDPDTLKRVFEEIDIDFENTGFLCISKSGETLETICQTIVALDRYANAQDLNEHFLVITESKQSTLKSIANDNAILCINHPKNIGGRFSVFSVVGMLPALLCDVNPLLIRSGAKCVIDIHQQDLITATKFICDSYASNFKTHVSFIYSDKLSAFGQWLSQLYAESTGKGGNGVTPQVSIGSIDQHSHLQLYLDGPRDKCFTFFIENQLGDSISVNAANIGNFKYLDNQKISKIFEAQSQATMQSMLEKKLNVRKICFPSITPEIMGSLFMHFMLEVTLVSQMIGADPFDQPAVERGKILTKELLSK